MTRTSAIAVRGAIILLGGSLLGFGCSEKDTEKCQEAQNGVRASVKAGDQALLTQWRDRAFKYCEESEFQTVDREITDQQKAKQQAEADKKKKEGENKALLEVFLTWVGQNKAAPERAAAATCVGDAEQEKAKERWCNGTRQAGAHPLNVSYWEGETVGASFSVKVPNPITCDALGPSRIIRSWVVQGSIKRHHCELTGGPAAGMQALVTEASNAPLQVFSSQFLTHHAGMQAKVSSEGR